MNDAAIPNGSGVAELVESIEKFRSFKVRRAPAELRDALVGLRHACDLLELTFADLAAEFASSFDESLA